MTADVQVVVVRWRHGRELDACLRSLVEHGGPRLGRITVVDSGSGDNGADRLRREFPEAGVVAIEDNQGFAHAASAGTREGNEELILLLNPDTVVPPGTIEVLADGLDTSPRVAAVVPILDGNDGVSQHRWQLRRLPSVTRLALGLPGRAEFPKEPTSPQPVAQPAAAAWLLRRTVWDALNGLDPIYAPAWWEDVDFCARLRIFLDKEGSNWDRGFVVHPACRILHAGGSSVSALGERQFLVAYNTNLLLYAARHHTRHVELIRRTLIATLGLRGLIRPSRRDAYRAAADAVRTATPVAHRESPGRAAGD